MAIEVKKETGTVYKPVWQLILEDIPGGVTLSTSRVPSTTKELKAGTMLANSGTTGIYQFIKTGKSVGTQTAATARRFVAPVEFNANEFIFINGKTTGSTILRIARSANTVTIATKTALGTLGTASIIGQCAAAGATALLYSPVAVTRDDVEVRNADLSTLKNVTAGAVVRGTLDESVLPYPVTSGMKTALTARFRFA